MATIKKRGDSYLIRAYDGYDANGKQIERTMTWKPQPGWSEARIKKELEKVKVHFEDEVSSGLYATQKIKFEAFAEKWVAEYAVSELSAKTVQDYRALLPRINKQLGHLFLDKIRPFHLAKLQETLLATPIESKFVIKGSLKTALKKHGYASIVDFSGQAGISEKMLNRISAGHVVSLQSAEKVCAALSMSRETLFSATETKTLSANTVCHYMRLVSSILSKAVEWQYIPANPADRVKPPRKGRNEQLCLTQQEALHMLECLQQEPMLYRTAVTLLLMTGMRREELYGLHWRDVDFEKGLVSIYGTVQYIGKKGPTYCDRTKTASSTRVIKISKSALAALKQCREYQSERWADLAIKLEGREFVFSECPGKLPNPNNLTRWFHKFVSKNGLPPIHIHSLRHTAATLLITNNMPITVVAANLGHATPNTTTTIYAHALKVASAMAADAMDDLFASG